MKFIGALARSFAPLRSAAKVDALDRLAGAHILFVTCWRSIDARTS